MSTKNTTGTATITRRTRSLGIGWRNDTEQTRAGLRVKRPTRPDVVGTVKDVRAELERARRINSGGTDWRRAFFLGGRRVAEVNDVEMEYALELLANGIDDEVKVRFIDD